MKRLLIDATTKLRRMVDESKQLTGRIDADIDASTDDTGLRGPGEKEEEAGSTSNPEEAAESVPDADDAPPYRPPSPLPGPSSQPDLPAPTSTGCEPTIIGRVRLMSATDTTASNVRLRLENERLSAELAELRKMVTAASDSDSDPRRAHAVELELRQAREALATLKADRKRLKAEKFDLLAQMKQLYGTLEDKEKELRDFIRNYEQRIRDSDASLEQLGAEREERERERWSLLRHARDEAERSLALAAQLDQRDQQVIDLRDQLQEARHQLGGCLSDQESLASVSISRVNGSTTSALLGHYASIGLDRGSCSADSGLRGSSDRESTGATSVGGNLSDSTQDGTPTIMVEGDMDNISMVSSIAAPHMYQSIGTPKDCSPSLSPLNAFSQLDGSALSRSVEQLSSPLESDGRRSKPGARSGSRGGTWGSISRVFARGRHRSKAVSLPQEGESDLYNTWSPLTEVGYAEKLRLLREASSIPMERWRAPTVLAWLEIALGMPQYGPRCAENVKSGKALLELSDVELEVGLGIQHPMHRKKLRLAIEEHRHPGLVRYQAIAQLGHTWVSSEWLPDLGLAQYAENFATNMVDARMLDHLSKKELEKFLGVTRKFHQASIVHGIHLLRLVKYDRQALAVRRHQCEAQDVDPLVWTNQRFVRWARNIDLSEYADNLKDSGVHGALVVLEPSFNGDTMATALGIPPSKNIIRRHLSTELEALVLPARYVIFCQMEEYHAEVARASKHRSCDGDWSGYDRRRAVQGSLGRNFSRSTVHIGQESAMVGATADQRQPQRSSLRGSLSRAFGFKVRQESNASHIISPSSSSESRSSPNASPTGSQSGGTLKRRPNHRRVKSIGDIDIVAVTPV